MRLNVGYGNNSAASDAALPHGDAVQTGTHGID